MFFWGIPICILPPRIEVTTKMQISIWCGLDDGLELTSSWMRPQRSDSNEMNGLSGGNRVIWHKKIFQKRNVLVSYVINMAFLLWDFYDITTWSDSKVCSGTSVPPLSIRPLDGSAGEALRGGIPTTWGSLGPGRSVAHVWPIRFDELNLNFVYPLVVKWWQRQNPYRPYHHGDFNGKTMWDCPLPCLITGG